MENEKQQSGKAGKEQPAPGITPKEGEGTSEIKNAHASGMGSLGKSDEQPGELDRNDKGETRED